MTRVAAACLLALAAPVFGLADPPPLEWKKGSVGAIPLQKGAYFNVLRVVAPGELIVLPAELGRSANGATAEFAVGPAVYVKGVTTAGVQKGTSIKLDGAFKVTGEYVFMESSIWVVEKQK